MSAARNPPPRSLSEAGRMEGLPPLSYDREQWLELERKELQRRFRATGTARAGQTATLAVALLDLIAGEYWNIWEASGERAEVFVRWLPSIKSRALAEVGDIWRALQADLGEPPSGLRYDCNWPVVEVALSEAVDLLSAKARWLERQRLDPSCPAIEGKSLNRLAEVAELAFRCTSSPWSVLGEPSMNGDVGPGHVPDSAMAENITADPKAKAIESGNKQRGEVPEEPAAKRAKRAKRQFRTRRKRPRRSVESPIAAQKMCDHMDKHGLTFKVLAGKAEVHERTLRKFSKTKKIGKGKLHDIANAIGTTYEEILRQEP